MKIHQNHSSSFLLILILMNNINNMDNKKLALANILKLKIDNDTTFTIVNGARVSSLRVMLEEIYNNIF